MRANICSAMAGAEPSSLGITRYNSAQRLPVSGPVGMETVTYATNNRQRCDPRSAVVDFPERSSVAADGTGSTARATRSGGPVP
jgi:hypothetical protein